MGSISNEAPWKKTSVSFVSGYQLELTSGFGMGSHVHFSVSALVLTIFLFPEPGGEEFDGSILSI